MSSPRFQSATPFLSCTDLMATVAYYRDVLGFTGEWHWFYGEPPTEAGVSRDEVRIILTLDPARAATARGTVLFIAVRDVAAAYAEHQASGADITDPLAEKPWGTTEYTVEDINGYALHFNEAPE